MGRCSYRARVMQRLEATYTYTTTKACWQPVARTTGGGAVARRSDTSKIDSSIDGRRMCSVTRRRRIQLYMSAVRLGCIVGEHIAGWRFHW
jgi:hypothetical protein